MQATITRYSVEEYLERETTAEFRSEYRDGEIVPITGGTLNHNQIINNFCLLLMLALQDRPYRRSTIDVRLSITATNNYTYPDLMVIATPVIYAEDRRDTITNPQIIVEVLSPSTRDYDRGEKFKSYRTVDSFQEYILIDQYNYYVEQFTKTEDGKWLLSEYKGDEAVLSLNSVEFQISLSDIYKNVEFE